MTSPPTKRTVRLQSLLDGNRRPAPMQMETSHMLHEDDDTMESIEDLSMLDSNICALEDSSPPKADVQALNKTMALKDILTGLPVPVHTRAREADKITLENKVNDKRLNSSSSGSKVALKQLLSGKASRDRKKKEDICTSDDLDLEEIQVIELGNRAKSRETHERIIKSLSNTKKTSLKSLFSNFSKPVTNGNALNLTDISEPVSGAPISRYHEISTLSEIPAPLPKRQLYDASENRIKYRPLTLRKKVVQERFQLSFKAVDYSFLKQKSQNFDEKCEQCHIFIKRDNSSALLWDKEFQPTTITDVLLADNCKQAAVSWMDKAFDKLRKNTSRNKLLKRKAEDDYLDGFVVDDEFDDSVDQMEEFVPLMILHGAQVGKNTLLNTIVKSHNGQIFEVNTSSNRSKKDILESVQDFSTTHFVKNKGSKGIILFDDVDILFRERDKLFWSAVERILATSRRPVVLTCRDISFLPMNIIQVAREENSIFYCGAVENEQVIEYLQECCRRKNVKMPTTLLKSLVNTNHGDVRKCLMDLQWISFGSHYPYVAEDSKKQFSPSLHAYEINSDMLSNIDIMKKNMAWKSSINQDTDATIYCPFTSREFTALSDEERLSYDYIVDPKIYLPDSLKRPLLPYELNISSYLQQQFPDLHGEVQFNKEQFLIEITDEVMKYLESRVAGNVGGLGRNINSDQYTTVRMTRNSRRVREIMDRLTTVDNSDRAEALDAVINSISSVSKIDLCQEINPMVMEIAKHDRMIKSKNKIIYEKAMDGIDPTKAKEVIKQLLVEHAFFPIWFKRDPRELLQIWENQNRSE